MDSGTASKRVWSVGKTASPPTEALIFRKSQYQKRSLEAHSVRKCASMISVPIRNGWYIFDMISHLVRWCMPYGILWNGYYIIFSRSGNISCGKAVYHISSEIYHSLRTEKPLPIFGKYLPFSKYVTHYDTFKIWKCHFLLHRKTEDTSLRSVSVRRPLLLFSCAGWK